MYSKAQAYYDYGVFEDDSMSEGNDSKTSSEDEIDIILHGTPEQRRKLQHLHRKKQDNKGRPSLTRPSTHSSSEDEFEKQVNEELDHQLKVIEESRGKQTPVATSEPGAQPLAPVQQTPADKADSTSKQEQMFYDQVYFDSDEEDNTDSPRKQSQAVLSNDDLLYDPDMDDKDQRWMDKQRQSHRVKVNRTSRGQKTPKLRNSDALLDCPACMTTLCLDCQRHEIYKHQYRAMFVMNCIIDKSELLQCPEQASKKKPKKKTANPPAGVTTEHSSQSDMFHPVRCAECNIVVGVIDHDEVYHFFNVLASYT